MVLKRSLGAWFCFLFFFSLPGSLLFSQTSSATIAGVVKDATGAVIPGVSVTAVRAGTLETRIATTGDSGDYRFLNLQPGVYTLKAELTGFKTVVNENLDLTIGEIRRVDFTLQVGEISEQVLVQGQAAVVQTETGYASELVEGQEVQDLPLNGRNIYQLAQLGPGVTPSLGRLAQTSGSPTGDTFNVNGQTHRGNNYLLNGTDNNYVGIGGTPTVTPQVDAVEEFRVNTSLFSAEYGRNSGAVINVRTKAGTNRFHGTFYNFHRNDNLDARETFESCPAGQDCPNGGKPEFIMNQPGFTIGGPIFVSKPGTPGGKLLGKNYFFFGYEAIRVRTGEGELVQAETQQLVDFVNQTRPNSIAAQLFQRFPLVQSRPTTGRDIGSPAQGVLEVGAPDGIPDIGEVSIAAPDITRTNEWTLRVDHEINDNNKVFGSFTREKSVDPAVVVRPSNGSDSLTREQAFSLGWTSVFSPTLVNEFTAGYNQRKPLIDVQEGTFEIPTIRINGFSNSAGFGANSNIPQFFARHVYQFADQVAWTLGDHTLKIGGEYRHARENSDFQANTRGNFAFDSILDFIDDEASSQTNLVDPETLQPVGTPRHFRVNEWALYVQDDWKVTPNFTLNLGLRYENFRPPHEKDRIQSNVVFGEGSSIFERLATAQIVPFGRSDIRPGVDLFDPDNNNFAPRIGFAWDPTGEGKWAVRGGYGISYNRIFMNITSNIKFNPPAGVVVTADVDNGLPIIFSIPTRVDPSLLQSVAPRISPNFIDPDLPTAYVQSIFFGIQRELFEHWLVEANFVSTLGRKQYAQESFNRFTGDLLDGVADGFNPGFNIAADDFLTADINQNYYGGQFQVSRRFRGGLGFRVNYTVSKNIDSDTDVFGADSDDPGTQAIENRFADRGLSSIDVRERLSANWVWELPWFQTHSSGWVRNILGGWQLNGLIALQSGTPTTINADTSSFTSRVGGVIRGDFNGDGRSDDRPNAPGFDAGDVSPAEARNGSIFAPFSPTSDARLAFPRPVPGTSGNLGRNTFFLDGFNSVDFSIFKNWSVPWFYSDEGATLQFRVEVFNAFNNVNTDSFEEDIASANFGRTFTAFDAREIQFGLKFVY